MKFLVLFVITCLNPFEAYSKLNAPPTPVSLPGEYLVKGGSIELLQSFLLSESLPMPETLPFGYNLVKLSKKVTDDEANVLFASLGFEKIQRNYVYRISSPLIPLGVGLLSGILSSCSPKSGSSPSPQGKPDSPPPTNPSKPNPNDPLNPVPVSDFEKQ